MMKKPQIVAIVDDDASLLKSLMGLLKSRSFAVRAFQSGPQFLASLTDELPDCLIFDLNMPEMNGLEIIHHLTKSAIQIPTIVITAHDELINQQQCETAGVIAFLSKPAAAPSLFAAIEAAVRTRRPTSGIRVANKAIACRPTAPRAQRD